MGFVNINGNNVHTSAIAGSYGLTGSTTISTSTGTPVLTTTSGLHSMVQQHNLFQTRLELPPSKESR